MRSLVHGDECGVRPKLVEMEWASVESDCQRISIDLGLARPPVPRRAQELDRHPGPHSLRAAVPRSRRRTHTAKHSMQSRWAPVYPGSHCPAVIPSENRCIGKTATQHSPWSGRPRTESPNLKRRVALCPDRSICATPSVPQAKCNAPHPSDWVPN